MRLAQHLRTLAIAGSCTALALAAAPAAEAGLIAYEGFDYAEEADLDEAAGGTGFGTNAWDAHRDYATTAASLSYTDANGNSLPTTGRAVEVAGQGKSAIRVLDEPITAGTVWVSFLMEANAHADRGRSGFTLELWSGDPGDGGQGRAYAGTPHITAGEAHATTGYGLGFRPVNVLDTNGDPDHHRNHIDVEWTGLDALDDPSVHFIVLKYAIGQSSDDGEVHMFMNPILGAEPDVSTAHASHTGLDSLTMMDFDRIQLDTGGGNDLETGGLIDEIRLGGSYETVAVPEPASLGLLAAGLGLGLMRRRRA